MNNSEHKIQSECVRWLWNEKPQTRRCFFMVYNNPKNKAHGAHLKSIGMIAGVSDTIFVWRGKTYFIEFKDKNGKQSEDQEKFQSTIELQDLSYHIIRSLEQFKILINYILNF